MTLANDHYYDPVPLHRLEARIQFLPPKWQRWLAAQDGKRHRQMFLDRRRYLPVLEMHIRREFGG